MDEQMQEQLKKYHRVMPSDEQKKLKIPNLFLLFPAAIPLAICIWLFTNGNPSVAVIFGVIALLVILGAVLSVLPFITADNMHIVSAYKEPLDENYARLHYYDFLQDEFTSKEIKIGSLKRSYIWRYGGKTVEVILIEKNGKLYFYYVNDRT